MILTEKVKQIQIILQDSKAQDIYPIYLKQSDYEIQAMVITTATSNIHAKSVARHLKSAAKTQNLDYLSIEGENNAEWILLDLDDVVVHIMSEVSRQFYQLESLWGPGL